MSIFEFLRSKIEDIRSTFSVQRIFSDDNNFFVFGRYTGANQQWQEAKKGKPGFHFDRTTASGFSCYNKFYPLLSKYGLIWWMDNKWLLIMRKVVRDSKRCLVTSLDRELEGEEEMQIYRFKTNLMLSLMILVESICDIFLNWSSTLSNLQNPHHHHPHLLQIWQRDLERQRYDVTIMVMCALHNILLMNKRLARQGPSR